MWLMSTCLANVPNNTPSVYHKQCKPVSKLLLYWIANDVFDLYLILHIFLIYFHVDVNYRARKLKRNFSLYGCLKENHQVSSGYLRAREPTKETGTAPPFLLSNCIVSCITTFNKSCSNVFINLLFAYDVQSEKFFFTDPFLGPLSK